MERNLGNLKKEHFHLVIIGGGISGLSIAYEASLRGYKTALIERKDFAWATSAATSKLVHGGLRYLKNFEFSLVRESLHERRILMQIAPHLVYPLPFLLPVYADRSSMFTLKAGLTLYDWLAYDRNRIAFQEKHIPKHRTLTRDELLRMDPFLPQENLKGGLLYYDAQMYDPNRLSLLFALGAEKNGARIANYCSLQGIQLQEMSPSESRQAAKKKIAAIAVKDELSTEEFSIKGDFYINASGPWADKVFSLFPGTSSAQLTRSKGIHLITKKIDQGRALTLMTRDKRHIFILPWKNYSLIGTTDDPFLEPADELCVEKNEIHALLNQVNDNYKQKLDIRDVYSAYAGLRPLVEKDIIQTEKITEKKEGSDEKKSSSSYDISRKFEILSHSKDLGLDNFYSILGGKYTTSRGLAEKVLNVLVKRMRAVGKDFTPSDKLPLPGGDIQDLTSFFHEEMLKIHDNTLRVDVVSNLRAVYGSEIHKITDRISSEPALANMVQKNSPDIWAQIDHALEEEMAVTLSDIFLRRTSLATATYPEESTIQEVAQYLKKKLSWNREETENNIENYKKEVRAFFPFYK